MTKAKPNDKDAKNKYQECNKIVKRLAFEKAIAVEDNQKNIADLINLESMSKYLKENLLYILEGNFLSSSDSQYKYTTTM